MNDMIKKMIVAELMKCRSVEDVQNLAKKVGKTLAVEEASKILKAVLDSKVSGEISEELINLLISGASATGFLKGKLPF